MKPEARVWRKTGRRSNLGRRRGTRPAGLDTAKVLRRVRRFHALRQRGLEVEEAGRRLGLPYVEAWRIEDFLTSLIDDLKEGTTR